MVSFLLWICFMCFLPVRSSFDGICPRQDPPPGALVVPSGSKLLLTCSGLVKVNGQDVIVTRVGSNAKRNSPVGNYSATKSNKTEIQATVSPVHERHDTPTTEAAVRAEPGEQKNVRYTPTTYMPAPATVSRTPDGQSGQENEEINKSHEVEEGKGISRVKRDFKQNPQWKWRRQPSWDKDITLSTDEANLYLDSVNLTDAGTYRCHHGGVEMTAMKVIVADPPETPVLSCYKRFPSSKIRCEWRPRKPIVKHSQCYLLLRRGIHKNLTKIPCSYSAQHSRFWCALDHSEDDGRAFYQAFLCVTGIWGNTISSVLSFSPLGILQPDPPTNVSVHQKEGSERRLRVTWSRPKSWFDPWNYYRLKYQINYKLLRSTHDLTNEIDNACSYTISDALPGREYVIQLRVKEQYDGTWSDWSSPIIGSSWIAKIDNLTFTEFDLNSTEGSGSPTDEYPEDIPDSESTSQQSPNKGLHFIVWIACLFILLSLILTIFVFRHKDRLMSKLHGFSVIPQLGHSPPPPTSAPAAPEGEIMVTLTPQFYKEHPLNDVQEGEGNEEEQPVTDGIEALHFNNTSYFFVQKQL